VLSESVRHASNLPRSEISGSPQIGKRDCIRSDLTPLSATRQEGFRASRKVRSERLGTTKFATHAEYSIIRRSEGFHPGKIVDHKGRVMDARKEASESAVTTEQKPTNHSITRKSSTMSDTTETTSLPIPPMAPVCHFRMPRPGEAGALSFDKTNVTEFLKTLGRGV
jgi:hypothetical protein